MKCKVKDSWIKSELEHTNSKKVARAIVNDHIREYGCNYYPALFKLKKNLTKRGGSK